MQCVSFTTSLEVQNMHLFTYKVESMQLELLKSVVQRLSDVSMSFWLGREQLFPSTPISSPTNSFQLQLLFNIFKVHKYILPSTCTSLFTNALIKR